MGRIAWAVQGFGFLVLLGGIYYLATQPEAQHVTHTTEPMHEAMIVRSPAFNHEESIPSKYTCVGDDVAPPLAIDGVPDGTRSLALIVDDPDAPSGTWDHWLLFNMPHDLTRIGEGDMPVATSGTNSWGNLGYGGPCPPDGEHRYLFKVYALDTMLELPEGSSKQEIETAMEGHVLEKATLMGRFKK